MNPKSIIIKTQSKEFFNAFIYKIKDLKNIRFFGIKINGFYTIVIKCHNYYSNTNLLNEKKLYGSYIFLYSVISIILSELFMTYYEHIVSKRIILSKKDNKININKLSYITSLLLDKNSPLEFSKYLYNKRKKLLLDTLLRNFRKRNFIYTDYFIDFSAKKYIEELDQIIISSIEIINNKSLYNHMINYVFQNNSKQEQ